MLRKVRIAAGLSAMLVVLASAVAGAAVTYKMIDLGTLGGKWSKAYGVNSSGYAVGAAYDATSKWRSFVYEPGVGMRDLGSFGGGFDAARAINDTGQVAGISQVKATGDWRAYLYTPGEGMANLGALNNSSTSEALGINAQGHVVGYSFPDFFSPCHPIFYSKETGLVDCGTIGTLATAWAVNSSDMAVGTYELSGKKRAFYWTRETGIRDIPAKYSDRVNAFGVNDWGQVTGWTMTERGYRAFVWQNGQYTATLDPWYAFGITEGYAINNLGQVVGRASVSGTVSHAFVYTPGQGMVDLGTLVPGSNSQATSISSNGIIAGFAYVNANDYHAVMWVPETVPEPCSFLILGTGISTLLLRRRKH